MIILNKKTGKKLNKDDSCSYTLTMEGRIIINPAEKYIVNLPYIKDHIDGEYLLFEPDMYLAKNGIQILGHNLNLKESVEGIKILIYNNNIVEKLYNKKESNFSHVFGVTGAVDLKPGTILGKIFEIKQK